MGTGGALALTHAFPRTPVGESISTFDRRQQQNYQQSRLLKEAVKTGARATVKIGNSSASGTVAVPVRNARRQQQNYQQSRRLKEAVKTGARATVKIGNSSAIGTVAVPARNARRQQQNYQQSCWLKEIEEWCMKADRNVRSFI